MLKCWLQENLVSSECYLLKKNIYQVPAVNIEQVLAMNIDISKQLMKI